MKTPFWLYVISLVPPAILVAIGAVQPWVPPAELFRDPLVVAEGAGSGCCGAARRACVFSQVCC